MATDSFLDKLWTSIGRHRLLEPDDGIVVGVSGGADSMALLVGLHMLSRRSEARWRLHVAHLNHRLRRDSADADAEFVRREAASLQLPCTTECAEVPAASGVEESARRIRYAFLEEVARSQRCRVVAVGHHADDNIETILHRILRGTGLRGLSGIPASRELAADGSVSLVRPLSAFRRADLEAFLDANGVSFRVDDTNYDPCYTRNRIRHQLLPAVRAGVNDRADEAVLRLAEQARTAWSFLNACAESSLAELTVERQYGERVLDARRFGDLHVGLQSEVVRLALLSVAPGERRLTFDHLTSVARLVGAAAGGRTLHFPGQRRVVLESGRLRFFRAQCAESRAVLAETQFDVPGRVHVRERNLMLCSEIVANEPGVFTRNGLGSTSACRQECIDADRIHGSLIVRSRRRGDRFQPLGAPGGKTLADFMSDRKIRSGDRDRVPLVCDRLGPVWVVPYRIADRVRVTQKTRNVLRISARPLDPHHNAVAGDAP